MKKILIDCTLTGGRGPAKKATELVWECTRLNRPYFLLTDSKLNPILREMGITADKIIPINLIEDSDKDIYTFFQDELKKISFDILIKFGARTPGPYASRTLGKPYIIVDGGLPDKYEQYPSLYDKDTYVNAKNFIVTSNFPWIPMVPIFLNNVLVRYFPISLKTSNYISTLKEAKRNSILNKIRPFLTKFPRKSEFILNLNITNDYVKFERRVTYGAWLMARQYDQVVGFLRRLITDLGTSNKRITIIADSEISRVCTDLFQDFPNITPVSWKNKWNYYAEIALDAISNLTIARAANYQPYIFALARGNNITAVVPADGYMDEDDASIQAQALGLTYSLPYDDEQFVTKAISFLQDTEKQKSISEKQRKNFENFGKTFNCIDTLLSLTK